MANRLTSRSLPTGLDLEAYAGEPFYRTLKFWSDMERTLPIAFDGVWTAQIRRSSIDPTILQTFEIEDVNQASGEILIKLTEIEVTSFVTRPDGTRIAAFQGVWDIQFDPSAQDASPILSKKTIYAGTWLVVGDVSR